MGGVDLQGLARDYWHIGLVAVFLVIITIDFVVRFVGQSNKLSRELKQSLTALLAIRSNIKGDITELDKIGERAMSGPALSHLWSEYRKTLHPQTRADEHGQIQLVRWRSTALWEASFLREVLT